MKQPSKCRYRPRPPIYIPTPLKADTVFAVWLAIRARIGPPATILVVAGLYKPAIKFEIEVTANAASPDPFPCPRVPLVPKNCLPMSPHDR